MWMLTLRLLLVKWHECRCFPHSWKQKYRLASVSHGFFVMEKSGFPWATWLLSEVFLWFPNTSPLADHPILMPGKESKIVSKAHLGRQTTWTSRYQQHLNAVICATTVLLYIQQIMHHTYIVGCCCQISQRLHTTNYSNWYPSMTIEHFSVNIHDNAAAATGGALFKGAAASSSASWYANSSHDTGSQSNPRWRHVVVDLSQSAHVAPHRSVLGCTTKLWLLC